jgi:hypothetical protein
VGDWCVFASSQAGALLAEVLTGDAVLTSGRDSLSATSIVRLVPRMRCFATARSLAIGCARAPRKLRLGALDWLATSLIALRSLACRYQRLDWGR